MSATLHILKRLVTPPVLLVAIAMSACSSDRRPAPAEVGDGGFISGIPCSAPCFFGIQPGATTLQEAQEVLADAAVCASLEPFDTRSEGGTKGFQCGTWLTVTAGTEDDIADGVGFTPAQDLTLQDVLDALGPPDGVTTVPTGLPEGPRSTMLIYYDRFLTRLLLPEQRAPIYDLRPDVVIERIVYFEKSEFDALRSSAVPWEGFGRYSPQN